VILVIALVIALVVVLILYFRAKAAAVDTDKVLRIKGNYGAQEGVMGKALHICGSGGSEPCVFNAANTVEAFSWCSLVPDLCTSFSYQAQQNIVTFIDPNGETTVNPDVITFTRQVAVTTDSSLQQQQQLTTTFT
jgi:hypothetical protein